MSWYFLGADNCEFDNITTSDHSNSAVYYIVADQTNSYSYADVHATGSNACMGAKQQSSQMFKVRAI